MLSVDAVLRLIPAIYDASADDAMWPEIAQRLSMLFGDAAIGIDYRGSMRSPTSIAIAARFDESRIEEHYKKFSEPEKNIGVAALMRAPILEAFSLESFVDKRTYERDPGIRDILQPQKIDKALLTTLECERDAFSFASVYRRAHQPEFVAEDQRALDLLSPHIAKSLLFRQLRLTADRIRLLRDLRLAANPRIEAAVVVDRNSRLIEADNEALALLAMGHGLSVRNGRLVSTARNAEQDEECLRRFLASTQPGSVFTIRARQDAMLTLEPVPAGAAGRWPGRNVVILLVRRIPLGSSNRSARSFSRAFALTDAECRVMEALAESPTAAKAAAKLGVSRETIKSHLKNIYAKTDVSSLPQLMLLLGRFF